MKLTPILCAPRSVVHIASLRHLFLVAVTFALMTVVRAASATIVASQDPAAGADFQIYLGLNPHPDTNGGGTWSYLYSDTLNPALGTTGDLIWSGSGFGPPDDYNGWPDVSWWNAVNGLTMSSEDLANQPWSRYSVMRWTSGIRAPVNVAGDWVHVYNAGAMDAAIYVNGFPEFVTILEAGSYSVPFNFDLDVVPGTTIDFVAGPGGASIDGQWDRARISTLIRSRVDIQSVSITDRKLVLSLDGGPNDTGTLKIFLKNLDIEHELVSIPNQGIGEATIDITDDMIADLAPYDMKTFSSIVATWMVDAKEFKSEPRNFDDVTAIQILANWTVSGFFTPEYTHTSADGWTGPMIKVGAYPLSQFPGGLIMSAYPAEFLGHLLPSHEGIGIETNRSAPTMLMFVAHQPQGLFPRYSNKYYIETTNRYQTAAPCRTNLRRTSVAVRLRDNDAHLACRDRVYVPGFGIRDVDDHGDLHGNKRQVDVWQGQGGHDLAAKTNNIMFQRALLKLIK